MKKSYWYPSVVWIEFYVTFSWQHALMHPNWTVARPTSLISCCYMKIHRKGFQLFDLVYNVCLYDKKWKSYLSFSVEWHQFYDFSSKHAHIFRLNFLTLNFYLFNDHNQTSFFLHVEQCVVLLLACVVCKKVLFSFAALLSWSVINTLSFVL